MSTKDVIIKIFLADCTIEDAKHVAVSLWGSVEAELEKGGMPPEQLLRATLMAFIALDKLIIWKKNNKNWNPEKDKDLQNIDGEEELFKELTKQFDNRSKQ